MTHSKEQSAIKHRAKQYSTILIPTIVVIVLLILSLIFLSIYASVNPGVTFEQAIDTNDSSAVMQDIYTQITVGTESWENADKESEQIYGTQYDGVVYNNKDHEVMDWSVQFNVPAGSIIDSSWNGDYTFSEDGTTLTFNCLSSLSEVLPANVNYTGKNN